MRAIAMGGTCTGEHGVGIHKLDALRRGARRGAVDLMQTIKRALDPAQHHESGQDGAGRAPRPGLTGAHARPLACTARAPRPPTTPRVPCTASSSATGTTRRGRCAAGSCAKLVRRAVREVLVQLAGNGQSRQPRVLAARPRPVPARRRRRRVGLARHRRVPRRTSSRACGRPRPGARAWARSIARGDALGLPRRCATT